MSCSLLCSLFGFCFVWTGLESRWNVLERLHSRLLVKRNDQIESGGTKLKMCSIISLGISTSVMAECAGDCAIDSASDCVLNSASGCANGSTSIDVEIFDNDSCDMLIMSVVVEYDRTNAVCVV